MFTDTQSGFSGTYQSASRRATVAMLALAAAGLVIAWTAIHDLRGFELAYQAERGTMTLAAAEEYDRMRVFLGRLWLGANLLAAGAFLAWFSRTIDNIPALTGETPIVTPRWSIGWWFVPLAGLWQPYRIMTNANELLSPPGAAVSGRALIVAWWVLFVIGGFLGQALFNFPEPGTLDEFRTGLGITAAFDVAWAVDAVLAVMVVRHVQRKADEQAVSAPSLIASYTPA